MGPDDINQASYRTASYISTAVDASGVTYIAYRDQSVSDKATVKKFVAGSWEFVGTQGFSEGIANYTSLVLDSGTPYVVYQDEANSKKITVKKFDGSSHDYL